jgi:hypothetical protein
MSVMMQDTFYNKGINICLWGRQAYLFQQGMYDIPTLILGIHFLYKSDVVTTMKYGEH